MFHAVSVHSLEYRLTDRQLNRIRRPLSAGAGTRSGMSFHKIKILVGSHSKRLHGRILQSKLSVAGFIGTQRVFFDILVVKD